MSDAERPAEHHPTPRDPVDQGTAAHSEEFGDEVALEEVRHRNQHDDAVPSEVAPDTSEPEIAESSAGQSAALDPDGPASGGPASDGPASGDEPAADVAAKSGPADGASGEVSRASKRRKRKKAPWWELPALVAGAIAIAILVKSFVLQPFYIPSESMEHTLYGCSGCSGDRILVNKITYDFGDPHPGDIVVFNAPPGWDDEPGTAPPSNPFLRAFRGLGQLVGVIPPDGLVLVKRVIAVGGQTVRGVVRDNGTAVVQVSDDGGQHYRTLDEDDYVFRDEGAPVEDHAAFGPVTVPNGRLWVMGDHRNDSADSRYHCGSGGNDSVRWEGDRGSAGGTAPVVCADGDAEASTVPVDDVIGKAFVIAWPPSRWTTLGTPATFKQSGATAAATTAVPVAIGAMVMVPVGLLRRRRRRVDRSAKGSL